MLQFSVCKNGGIGSRTATSVTAKVPSGASTTGKVLVAINSVASTVDVDFTVEDFDFSAALSDKSVTAGQSTSQDFTLTTGTGFEAADKQGTLRNTIR